MTWKIRNRRSACRESAWLHLWLVVTVALTSPALCAGGDPHLSSLVGGNLRSQPNGAHSSAPVPVGDSALAHMAATQTRDAGLQAASSLPSALARIIAGTAVDLPSSPNLRSATAAAVYRECAPEVLLVMAGDSMGSGVIVNDRRLALTNWHVVGSNAQVLVFYKFDDPKAVSDKDAHLATVLKVDAVRDLALLEIQQPVAAVSPRRIGRLDNVEVGSDVVAIGHPSGLFWTLTEGIVSQIRRGYSWSYEDGSEHEATVIQTQTAINPGSSGGPLFNAASELIGLNSFSAGGESLHFAIASDEIESFLREPANARASGPAQTEEGPTVIAKLDMNNDGRDETWAIDDNGDGAADFWLIDANGDGKAEMVGYDLTNDGKLDTVAKDTDADGVLDTFLMDSDGDGIIDTVGLDTNGDGTIDKIERAKN